LINNITDRNERLSFLTVVARFFLSGCSLCDKNRICIWRHTITF